MLPLLIPVFRSLICCHLFAGPRGSRQLGAPDQAAIILLSADCRMMTQEDKPYVEDSPSGKHPLVPNLTSTVCSLRRQQWHLREELRSSDSHWPVLFHPEPRPGALSWACLLPHWPSPARCSLFSSPHLHPSYSLISRSLAPPSFSQNLRA